MVNGKSLVCMSPTLAAKFGAANLLPILGLIEAAADVGVIATLAATLAAAIATLAASARAAAALPGSPFLLPLLGSVEAPQAGHSSHTFLREHDALFFITLAAAVVILGSLILEPPRRQRGDRWRHEVTLPLPLSLHLRLRLEVVVIGASFGRTIFIVRVRLGDEVLPHCSVVWLLDDRVFVVVVEWGTTPVEGGGRTSGGKGGSGGKWRGGGGGAADDVDTITYSERVESLECLGAEGSR